jgi:hypothetical protein
MVQDQQRAFAVGLEEVQLRALAAAQAALPTALAHTSRLVRAAVAQYNLTPVVSELEKVVYRLPLAFNCTQVPWGGRNDWDCWARWAG